MNFIFAAYLITFASLGILAIYIIGKTIYFRAGRPTQKGQNPKKRAGRPRAGRPRAGRPRAGRPRAGRPVKSHD